MPILMDKVLTALILPISMTLVLGLRRHRAPQCWPMAGCATAMPPVFGMLHERFSGGQRSIESAAKARIARV
jgi:hypothetical protein